MKLSDKRALQQIVSNEVATNILTNRLDNFPYISAGTFNVVYDLGGSRILRTSHLYNDVEVDIQDAQSEVALAKIMGNVGIGPKIFWSAVQSISSGQSRLLSIQEHGGHTLLDLLGMGITVPAYCNIITDQLLILMCRLAAAGFAAVDIKPENILISGYEQIYIVNAKLIDFDPRYLIHLRSSNDIAAGITLMLCFLESHLQSYISIDYPTVAISAKFLIESLDTLVPRVLINSNAWSDIKQEPVVAKVSEHYFGADGFIKCPKIDLTSSDAYQIVGPLRFIKDTLPERCKLPKHQMKAIRSWKVTNQQ